MRIFRRVWARLGRTRWFLVVVGILVFSWAALPWLIDEGDPVSCHPTAASDGTANDLVILLHALNHTSEDLEALGDAVRHREALGDADVYACDLPFSTLSMARPETVVAQLVSEIDEAWTSGTYDRVFLVGHSMGGLFARKAYVVASGETAEERFEPKLKALVAADDPDRLLPPRPWAGNVERIVLMAGMNRGWSISHHMSLVRALSMSVGVATGEILKWRYRRLPLIFSIRRGAPFITELRLQWLEMRRQARAGRRATGGATTVQLLGTVDDLVSPEDNVDLVSGCDFIYLEVPRSGHANVVEMEVPSSGEAWTSGDEDQAARFERARVFIRAIAGERSELEAEKVLPADRTLFPQCGPSTEPPAGRAVTDVVFVIHGIRDEGFWTRKIAQRVEARGNELGKKVASESSTYGYFPMLSFLLPRVRRAKVEWLMDRYTEARARYPDARFHYVGHSNGTYLLAKALREYPSCRFSRVVFAGSVVRTDYPWEEAIGGQVDAILNFVAAGDWVVAYFPKALELVGLQDLGSAGHDGFGPPDSGGHVIEPALDGEPVYVRGGHSAALDEDLWDLIASFVIDDQIPELTGDKDLSQRFVEERNGLVSFLGRVAWLVWLLILAALSAALYALIKLPVREWLRTVIVLGYLSLIWTILTRI